MGLFYRRPLCFFAFVFLAFSLLCFFLPLRLTWIVLVVLAVLLLAFLGAHFIFKKHRIAYLTAGISVLVAILSVGHSLAFVQIPWQNASKYVGERELVAEILDEEYRSESYAIYSVRLLSIDGKEASVHATLSCYSEISLMPMDRIAAVGEVVQEDRRDRDGALLSVVLPQETAIYRQAIGEEATLRDYFSSFSGIRALSRRCQSDLRERMIAGLGKQTGALASAFFVGDRSAVPLSVARDFSRSGTAHLMAVSGLHFSVLLGALDWVLRKLYCPKTVRVVLISLSSIFFLFLTGFSMSACRAAVMLYAIYLTFLFREENDSITSLFVSLAMIVLLSPLAIVDLGLWMSFFATLGLLTVYPLLDERIPRSKSKKPLVRWTLRTLRGALSLILMTVIATLFLLPILWLFFGEMSIVSLIANPILSPISYLFLVSIPLWLFVSGIPLLSGIFGAVVCGFGEGIVWLLSFFSGLPLATVSLRFEFCAVLIPLFAFAMILVLVIRFRRRWLVMLPPVAFLVCFALCFGLWQAMPDPPSVTYLSSSDRNEAILVYDRGEVAICDLSDGSPWLYRDLKSALSEKAATEIQSIVLTHYHERHLTSLQELLSEHMVRTLYLPTPLDEEERIVAAKLWQSASDAGSEIVLYENGQISLTRRVDLNVERLRDAEAYGVALTLAGAQEKVTYVSREWLAASDETSVLARLCESRTVLVGEHGAGLTRLYGTAISVRGSIERVIYSSDHSLSYSLLEIAGAERYVANERRWSWCFDLP